MKRSILISVFLLTFVCLSIPNIAEAGRKKKVKESETKEQLKFYDKLLKTKGYDVVKGDFMTFHIADGKLYMEFPLKYCNRDVLLSSTVVESSNSRLATIGYKNIDPLHIKFVRIDSTMVIQSVNSMYESDEELSTALKRSYSNPFFKSYKIKGYNKDTSAAVFEVSDLFLKDEKLLNPVTSRYSVLGVKSTLKPELSIFGKVKSFSDNASVESYMTYDYSLSFVGMEVATGVLTAKVNRTFLLLSDTLMKPRISDSRVGVFLTQKQNLTTENDGIESYCYATRWRLEPKDSAAFERGELVEPKKPIVWYIDDSFPEAWKEPLRQSVVIWNRAFEKIGFKNVMIAKDFPKDDPDFDPDNLKYSCIRYVPIAVENAMGPSWVDPRTGEIINGSVLVYNDVIKLINKWRFIQTAQVDESVRSKKMPKDIIDQSLTYVFAHEIGHTLGFMHNMSASSAIPVDSLRSASFTNKYGTTYSIMDYARFNYVAQPEDKGVRLSPPDMGVYDDYIIKWLYAPIKGNLSVKDEAKVLESWVDEKAGDPIYRYGKQQVYSRYDPSAIEEDLGDDPIKASNYGISNLKYILNNLSSWIKDDESTAHRQSLYNEICSQYNRYLLNVLANVGGIYLNEVKDGTDVQRKRAVDKDIQRNSLLWVVNQIKDSSWLDNKELLKNFPLDVEKSITLQANIVKKLFSLNDKVLISSQISENPYTQKDYFDDLYTSIWDPTIKGKRLTQGDKLMQRSAINEIMSVAEKYVGGKKSGKSFSGSLFAPSVDEIALYGLDPTGYIDENLDMFRKIEKERGVGYVSSVLFNNNSNCNFNKGFNMFGSAKNFGDSNDYGFQMEVETSVIDESNSYYMDMINKILTLLKNRIKNANQNDRTHYNSILIKLNTLNISGSGSINK